MKSSPFADTFGSILTVLALALLLRLTRHHTASAQESDASPGEPEIVSLKMIWDKGPHNAFTDLIRFQNHRFCTFRESEHRVGGPNFIQLPDGSFWAGARRYPGGAKTVLAKFGLDTYEPVLVLPSGGDTSYPGLVWHEGLLWMSYYSSHEGKTSIYLAKIRLPD